MHFWWSCLKHRSALTQPYSEPACSNSWRTGSSFACPKSHREYRDSKRSSWNQTVDAFNHSISAFEKRLNRFPVDRESGPISLSERFIGPSRSRFEP